MIQQYRDSNQVIWFDEELIEDPGQPILMPSIGNPPTK